VLGDIEPKRSPESNHHELLMPADKGVARYRDKLHEWQDRGWRIDEEMLEATRVQATYTIPSPARRAEPKGWVLETVPLIPARRDAGKSAAASA
jgi:hypothetical protein